MNDGRARPVGGDSRVQRGGGTRRAVRAPLSGARRARAPLRGDLRQRRQPRPLGGVAEGAIRGAARRHARRELLVQLRPAHGDRRRLRARARRARRHARRRPAEPARGDRTAPGGDGRRRRLCGRRARDARGRLVAARCVARAERAAGESKYSLYRLIRLNFDLVTGFSVVPLQMFSLLGMAVSILSAIIYVVYIAERAINGTLTDGIASLWDRDILEFFLIGIVLFGLGIVGEYVGRIYQQVRERPRYRVRSVLERDIDPR